MSEQQLQLIKEQPSEIVVRNNGSVGIIQENQYQLLDHWERWEKACKFAVGVQLAIYHFTNKKVPIRYERG